MKEVFKSENILLREYLLHHTSVGDHIDIYTAGYYTASCIIDAEDLFMSSMDNDLIRTYIDSIEIYDSQIIDYESGYYGKDDHIVNKEACRHINIYLDDYSRTDRNVCRYKFQVDNEATFYTDWFDLPNGSKQRNEAFNKLIEAADALEHNLELLVLKPGNSFKSITRTLEFKRIFNKE